jgi:predicted nicotinamide N-methyase
MDSRRSAPLLALPGRLFNFDFAGGEFRVRNLPLHVACLPGSQRDAAKQKDADTGLTIWDGSVLLAKYLERRQQGLHGLHVLELGSGVGVVGLAAAALGANVVMTDLPYVMPSLQRNIDVTQEAWSKLRHEETTGSVTAHPLDWTNWEGNSIVRQKFDLIVGADIVWLEKLIVPLSTLLKHFAHTSRCNIFVSHQTRSRRTDAILFEELQKVFTISVVGLEDFPDTGQLKILQLVPLQEKPNTASPPIQ